VAVYVVGSRDAGHARVYGLTVSGLPEFYAQGVLVRNCLDALRYAVMSLPRPEIPKVVDMRPAVERLMDEEMKLIEARRRRSNAIV
jgi:hypothetical protein